MDREIIYAFDGKIKMKQPQNNLPTICTSLHAKCNTCAWEEVSAQNDQIRVRCTFSIVNVIYKLNCNGLGKVSSCSPFFLYGCASVHFVFQGSFIEVPDKFN